MKKSKIEWEQLCKAYDGIKKGFLSIRYSEGKLPIT